ncbi:hypothetical protein DL96DRAFT_1721775 [Flagelloscypha sp. PMI_526]|nr:hypothetical protein DL96DRAFT_1721775 [Flagelloscypha sp. PMI_526]
MSILPLDVLPDILDSLRVSVLRKCSLVNRYFHQITHRLLFSHLVLSSWDWEEKCLFLHNNSNVNRLWMIKRLSIQLDELPVLKTDVVPAELISLLVKLGPQIETLCIDGLWPGSSIGEGNGTPWLDISPEVRDCLCRHVMPSVQSLQFKEVCETPLLLILSSCPRLHHLHIGGELQYVDCTAKATTDTIIPNPFPEILSLTLEPFFSHHLDETRSLAHFLIRAGGQISSLTLVVPVTWGIRPNLYFLKPFRGIWTHLKHLTFGTGLYNDIAKPFPREFPITEMFPLANFSQLETVTIPMNIHFHIKEWDHWFNWVMAVLVFTGPQSIPTSFRAFRFSIPSLFYLKTSNSLPHPLDEMQDKFNIHLDFTVPHSAEMEKIDMMFALIRSTFPSWDAANKLNFLIEVYRPASRMMEWR